MKQAGRFEWAASIIDPAPDHHILEIGCGAGLLAALLAAKLRSGKLTAIDSSAAMIRMAVKRNKIYINAGISDFQTTEFLNANLPLKEFHSIIAFNVNFFWKSPEKELGRIRQLLLPSGKLFVCYQTPSGVDRKLLATIRAELINNHFSIEECIIEEEKSVASFCLIATTHS